MGLNLGEWQKLPPEEQQAVSERKKDREIESWELHCKGLSLSEISRRMSVSVTQTKKDVEAMKAVMADEVLFQLNMERAGDYGRLEALIDTFQKLAVENADPDAARVVLATMVRKSKLLGLDQPTKFQHTVTHGRPKRQVSRAELEEKLDKLYERLERRGRPIPDKLKTWRESRVIDVTASAVEEGTGNEGEGGRAAENAALPTKIDDSQ